MGVDCRRRIFEFRVAIELWLARILIRPPLTTPNHRRRSVSTLPLLSEEATTPLALMEIVAAPSARRIFIFSRRVRSERALADHVLIVHHVQEGLHRLVGVLRVPRGKFLHAAEPTNVNADLSRSGPWTPVFRGRVVWVAGLAIWLVVWAGRACSTSSTRRGLALVAPRPPRPSWRKSVST